MDIVSDYRIEEVSYRIRVTKDCIIHEDSDFYILFNKYINKEGYRHELHYKNENDQSFITLSIFDESSNEIDSKTKKATDVILNSIFGIYNTERDNYNEELEYRDIFNNIYLDKVIILGEEMTVLRSSMQRANEVFNNFEKSNIITKYIDKLSSSYNKKPTEFDRANVAFDCIHEIPDLFILMNKCLSNQDVFTIVIKSINPFVIKEIDRIMEKNNLIDTIEYSTDIDKLEIGFEQLYRKIEMKLSNNI